MQDMIFAILNPANFGSQSSSHLLCAGKLNIGRDFVITLIIYFFKPLMNEEVVSSQFYCN